jgi:hypothetical protein
MLLIYPVLWAVLGAAMVLAGHPSQRLPILGPAGPPGQARAAATTAYLSDLQDICRQRERQTGNAPVDVILREELAYTRRVAAVRAPPSMVGIRRSILQGRRRFDRALTAMNSRLSQSDHVSQRFVDALTEPVARIATDSNDRFARVGIVCRKPGS